MREAKYFKRLPNDAVRCELCPHYCVLDRDKTGKCRARKNMYGILYSMNYAQTVTVSVDPIEKKPLYHFHPGENILSIGSNSCNLTCDFCQNYSISQYHVPTTELTHVQLADLAQKYRLKFVAYTYTEPITWYEFVLESAQLLHKNKIKTVLVTNGYINPAPLLELLPYIDAMNIDLKSMSDLFYREICGGSLQPVLDSIKTVAGKCHLEITNLIIPGKNDSARDIDKLVNFIASIDPDIPLHFSRYFPHYKLKIPATSEETLNEARDIALKKLNYVYLGNILTDNSTYCPKCGSVLVERDPQTRINIRKNLCPECNLPIYGSF
ncbi:MAG: AmmeMemoRadiSam system radical SAM enzyme [Candidatus Cloacimonetes bacterium]|nr:AmmeMemoRadiSam system radical SAM enzyme [Candidatus Cloacimonadota bacterium]